jgi:hypothetical protein
MFSQLKVLIIKYCPNLLELRFSHHARYEKVDGPNMTWSPKAEELKIRN